MLSLSFSATGEIGRTLSKVPFYDWNCVMKSLLGIIPYIIQSSPPDVCPMRCYQYTTCEDCLNSKGSEGGAQSCIWASAFQEVSSSIFCHVPSIIFTPYTLFITVI